jgi:hypothetical protein
MRKGAIPPIAGCEEPDRNQPIRLALSGPTVRATRTALILSRGGDGVRSVLALMAV